MAAAREEIVGEMYVVRRHIDSGCYAELELEVRGRRTVRGIAILSTTYRSQPIKLTRDELKMARGLLWVAGRPVD